MIFLNDSEIEALKDLATSFLEHAGTHFWQGINLDEAIDNVRARYTNGGFSLEDEETEYGTELRDQACMIASCQMATRIVNAFGEGGTSYAIQPDFDMERNTERPDVRRYGTNDLVFTDMNGVVIQVQGNAPAEVPDEDIPF
jgi:hypothetical protein